MTQFARAPRIEIHTTTAHGGPTTGPRVVTPEVEPFRNVVELTEQGELGNQRPVRAMVAVVQWRPTQHGRPHDAVVVVTATVEEDAPESVRRMRAVGGQRVVEGYRLVGLVVGEQGREGMHEYGLRTFVEQLD